MESQFLEMDDEMKETFYGLLVSFLAIYFLVMFTTPREITLEKYKGHKVIEITKNGFLLGNNIQLYNPETKKVKIVLVHEIALKDIKLGEVIK